jgi:hypothetical protein
MATALRASNEKKWHEQYPELGTGPIPIEPYVSREYFEKERALIFRKVWLNAGRVEQIPNPGDYFVKDLAVLQTSILIVRGKDGAIRAFHNMCAHRGNKAGRGYRRNLQGAVHVQVPRLGLCARRVAESHRGRGELLRSEQGRPRDDADRGRYLGRVRVYQRGPASSGEPARLSWGNRDGIRRISLWRAFGRAIFLADRDKGELESRQRCFPGGVAYPDAAP